MGAIPVRWFVKKKDDNATLEDFIQVLIYLKDKICIDHMALGFDFMDYMEGMEDSNVIGMKDITQIQNIVDALKHHSFTPEEIERIYYKNAYDFMQKYLR